MASGKQFRKGGVELFEDEEVVVVLLPAPVHVGDAYASLKGLVHFSLLHDAKTRSLRFASFVLLALEDKPLVGLRVRGPVQKGIVLAFELGVEPEALSQPDF